MKSVFMGKNVAQWLMKSIEQIVVGISSKNFYSFREDGLAYTLQRSSNSFGMFLLLTEFKVGGRQSQEWLEGFWVRTKEAVRT